MLVRDFLNDGQVLQRADAPLEPVVSVVLPTYQRFAGGALARAIESVLAQSFSDLELIVVDDGSVDGTRGLIQDVQRVDRRVVHVRHERNCGLPALRVNEGIERARGRLVAFQFDDDEWLEGGLAALVEAAEGAPREVLVVGRAEWVARSWQVELPREPIDLPAITRRNDIANNAVLVPRSLFARCGLYDPHVGMRRLCDWDLWLRVLRWVPVLLVDRLVSRVLNASDATAIEVTAPLDLPLCRFLMSVPREAALGLDRWRECEVDSTTVAGITLPAELAERVEREQLTPFRARFPPVSPPRPSTAASAATPVLLVAADDLDPALDLELSPYDRRPGAGPLAAAPKQVLHPIAELGREGRRAMRIDLLLLARTRSATATGVAADVLAQGGPVAYYAGDRLPQGDPLPSPAAEAHGAAAAPGASEPSELERQLWLVDTVWAAGAASAGETRRMNPRVLTHEPAIAESWLPESLAPRGSSGRLRVAVLGGPLREAEAAELERALAGVASRWGGRLAVELWGCDAAARPRFRAERTVWPLPAGAAALADLLRRARLDVVLLPVRADQQDGPGLSAPAEYQLAAVAGALPILAAGARFDSLPYGSTCLRASPGAGGWEGAIEKALGMSGERFDAMRRALLEHVRLALTAESRADTHHAACLATALHAATRECRVGGRPRVLYLPPPVAGSWEDVLLWRSAAVARQHGLEPIVACAAEAAAAAVPPDARGLRTLALHASESARPLDSWPTTEALRALIATERPALVHAASPAPGVAGPCGEAAVPLLVTPARWRSAPSMAFELGLRRIIEGLPLPSSPRRVVMIGDAREPERAALAVRALGGRSLPYAFEMEVWVTGSGGVAGELERLARAVGLQGRVRVMRASQEPVRALSRADLLLDLGDGELPLPGSVLALACAVPVVSLAPAPQNASTVAPWVLCARATEPAVVAAVVAALEASPAARAATVRAGHRWARAAAHPGRLARDLMALYLEAAAAPR